MSLKILIHKLFHKDKHDVLLYDFGGDIFEHEYDARKFYICNKCGVHTVDCGYHYEENFIQEYEHWVDYYKDDTEYKRCLRELMARELMK